MERVHPRSAKSGAAFFEQPCVGQDLVLYIFGQLVKLRLKFIAYLNGPFHHRIMA